MVGAMEAKTPFRLLMEHDGYMDPFELGMSGREDLSPQPPSLQGRGNVVEGEAVDVTPTPGLDTAGTPTRPPTGEGGVRSPVEVKAWLVQKAGELAMRNKIEATTEQRAKVMLYLNQCFAPDPMADKKRADVCKWLTGYATLERMPGVTVLALGVWLIGRTAEGKMFLNEQAKAEAGKIWSVSQVVS